MNLSWVAWGQTAAVRWVPPVLYAVLAFVLAGGCAHSREGASASGSSQPTESPWALPTSTMRWNEYASELIGDLGVALGAGPVVILATKDDAPEDALGGIGVQGDPGVIQEARQAWPQPQHVRDGLADAALGQHPLPERPGGSLSVNVADTSGCSSVRMRTITPP
jgi:hypothetical protein